MTLNGGALGDIELAGGSLAPSYFADHLPLGGQDGFHATGDTGFVNDAELFVTGRISDRIKVNGQSFFAADFEQAVDRLPCVRQLGLGAGCRLQQSDPASPVQNQSTRVMWRRTPICLRSSTRR